MSIYFENLKERKVLIGEEHLMGGGGGGRRTLIRENTAFGSSQGMLSCQCFKQHFRKISA